MSESSLVPLNIVMTYPVHWGRYEVLRDFVQNFYDSVDCREWNDAFQHKFENGTLSIWIENVSFSYEWLLHIGASTKTRSAESHAGYYGEGFKVAALCAYRDLDWSINMASKDWELTVTELRETIDGHHVGMLAYDIRKVESSPLSMLTLGNLRQLDYELFKAVLQSFYYPENPLLGKKLWEGSIGAVYTRSQAAYNKYLPRTRDYGPKGAVFCGYQLLGSSPFNLVVCLHEWRKSDRERKALYTFDVVDVFETIAYYVDADGAMAILEKMRRYWNTTPSKKHDINSWHSTISKLISAISRSPDTRQRFREKYPNLLCQGPVHTVRDRNRRSQARSWLSEQQASYKLVQPAFRRLDYMTLEDKCAACGGFVVDDNPTDSEHRCFEILEGVVAELFAGFFIQEAIPTRKVIRNRRAAYHGMATLHKVHRGPLNNRGLVQRYKVGEIYLKESAFTQDGFFDAVATYVHESCHAFGGDSSESFSLALTLAMEILLGSPALIEQYRKLWHDAFAAQPTDERAPRAVDAPPS